MRAACKIFDTCARECETARAQVSNHLVNVKLLILRVAAVCVAAGGAAGDGAVAVVAGMRSLPVRLNASGCRKGRARFRWTSLPRIMLRGSTHV